MTDIKIFIKNFKQKPWLEAYRTTPLAAEVQERILSE
jgi:hypothetical protein